MQHQALKLYVSKAVGRGSTELAAFDAARVGAGVANLNLIRLSSVIPPHSEVVVVERYPFGQEREAGDRLYAVWAERRTSSAGQQIWAGLGWSRDRDRGIGLFVEHDDVREQDVITQITASLADLQAIRGLELGPVQTCVIGALCTGTPTCVLAICIYETERWLTAGDERPRPSGPGLR